MPKAGEENSPPAAATWRDILDFDLDPDVDSWPFDPAAFAPSPPSLFLPSSPPPQSLLQFSFPPPSSPLWFSEDLTSDISGTVADASRYFHGNSVQGNGNIEINNGKLRLQISAVEEDSDSSCLIKERISQALRYFKEWTDQHVLVQVWAPVKNGDRYFLTTSGQPFVLDPQNTGLFQYRTVSSMYTFSIDEDSDGYLGLPGRVFKQKQPEWTPNVQYYSCKEYPRLNHALNYNVRGSLALPVFEPSGQSCVGVVELIMTSQKINYAPEVDKVCKALEAVNLKSSEILDQPNIQLCKEGCQAALAEILEILTVVCEAHKLPLAQTWVPCKHHRVLAHGGDSKKSCSSFDGSCMGQVCMSTTDLAFYVIEAHMWGFRDACVQHHLQKGQGVAGRTFESQRPCFSRDVRQFCKTEYPLVHYARMFGLSGCLAICLQSIDSGSENYILEFFLPPDCKEASEQQALLDSISTLMKQFFRNLKVIAGLDLEESLSLEMIDMIEDDDHELRPKSCEPNLSTYPETSVLEGLDDSLEQHSVADVNAEKTGDVLLDPNTLGTKNNRTSERRRGKAEKSISLEVLRQYFTGSLKDAARSLGVCPTTMKRICRQHGISRWPSRKINKVNRSLSKLKRVMESVQGAGGSISWPLKLDVSTQSKGAAGEKNFLLNKALESDDPCNKPKGEKGLVNDQTASQLEPSKGLHCLKTRSSSDGSMGTPASQGLCQGSPVNGTHSGNPISSSNLNQEVDTKDSLGFTSEPIGNPILAPLFSMAEAIIVEPHSLLGGMLVEDSGSSKDLRNLCYSTCNLSRPNAIQEPRTVTIKASYKEDIIRFRLPCNAGAVTLIEEVAKRLKLEVGTFDIKYLEDDREWVMLACDADLEECLEISRVLGGHVIRLSVHDKVAQLGSSCESSWE